MLQVQSTSPNLASASTTSTNAKESDESDSSEFSVNCIESRVIY